MRRLRSVTSLTRATGHEPLALAMQAKVDMDDVHALIKEARASIMEVRKVRGSGLTGIAQNQLPWCARR